MKRIYVIGTADTKGEELAYLAGQIAGFGAAPVIVDVGTRAPRVIVDVGADAVAGFRAENCIDPLATDDRGAAVAAMGTAFARYIVTCDDMAGIVGIGGGGGTSIVTAGMRELPLGLPKLMVSTLASGDIAPYVDISDITMMPSVTDLAGLNRVSRIILNNAAGAIAGMCNAKGEVSDSKPSLGLTMFGVTTPAVTAIVDILKADYDCLVFHATGTGGRAMEKLAGSGMLTGVIDITTTEICDLLLGGALSAGPARMDVIAEMQLPYVGSVGALDMVNFLALDTVPEKYRTRKLYKHNPHATLMRVNAREAGDIGKWIAAKLNAMEGPVRFLIPLRGVSALDQEGADFFDPNADAALFDAIETGVVWDENRQLEKLDCHINDAEFAQAVAEAWRGIAQ